MFSQKKIRNTDIPIVSHHEALAHMAQLFSDGKAYAMNNPRSELRQSYEWHNLCPHHKRDIRELFGSPSLLFELLMFSPYTPSTDEILTTLEAAWDTSIQHGQLPQSTSIPAQPWDKNTVTRKSTK